MTTAEIYQRQAALLVRTLPFVAEAPAFALKGGTAINLFVRNLPRLSVDIDLTYLPIEMRSPSLARIDAAMKGIARRIRRGLPGAETLPSTLRPEGVVNKLFVRADGVQIKVEVTPVVRGCVYPPVTMRVSPAVEDAFGYVEARVVSFDDLFAGKMVAALDRQHPRDLFDIRGMLANEGLPDTLRTAFVVYLISHNRPARELLAPRRRDFKAEFQNHFIGMAKAPVTFEALVKAREQLVEEAIRQMPEHHKRFLIDFERGSCDWGVLSVSGVESLPAVRWKLQNLAKLAPEQRVAKSEALERVWE